jgi:Transglutaminase-like superfamily
VLQTRRKTIPTKPGASVLDARPDGIGMNFPAFFELSPRQKATLAFAWLLLGWYWAVLKILSWNSIARDMQLQGGLNSTPGADMERKAHAADVGRLVAIAARYTPWKSLCLVQVLATRRLLIISSIPYQVHIGVKNSLPSGGQPGFAAHAWLTCDNTVVSGSAGHDEYKVICSYTAANSTMRTMPYG